MRGRENQNITLTYMMNLGAHAHKHGTLSAVPHPVLLENYLYKQRQKYQGGTDDARCKQLSFATNS